MNGIFKKKITESDAANEFNFLNGLVNCNQKIENVSNNKNFELINKNSNLQVKIFILLLGLYEELF